MCDVINEQPPTPDAIQEPNKELWRDKTGKNRELQMASNFVLQHFHKRQLMWARAVVKSKLASRQRETKTENDFQEKIKMADILCSNLLNAKKMRFRK